MNEKEMIRKFILLFRSCLKRIKATDPWAKDYRQVREGELLIEYAENYLKSVRGSK